MSFQGDVAGIGLGELLQGLARGGREGVLRLHSADLSSSLGLQGGQIHLLPEPDEEPEVWRRRCERSWVKDPDHRIDVLRMSEIAYASRLEVIFGLLDAEGVHFRFEPRPLNEILDSSEDDEGEAAENLRRSESRPVHCPGVSVEFLLLEYARLSDDCQRFGDSRRLAMDDVPRVLDAQPPSPEFEKFWVECDGMSNLLEISDRLGWPMRQTGSIAQQLLVEGRMRLADSRELLVQAQQELKSRRFARAASRLTGWVRHSPGGPPPVGDVELLLNEWKHERLMQVMDGMPAREARALFKRIDLVSPDPEASVRRWKALRKRHRQDLFIEVRLIHCQLLDEIEPDTPTAPELLRLARLVQDAGSDLRAAVFLRAAAARLPEGTGARLELGTRMLEVGMVEDGAPWLVEACRTLIESGHPEKSIGPLRTVTAADPNNREARKLLGDARGRSARGRRRRRNSLVGLAILLTFSLIALVRVHFEQKFERKMGEVTDLMETPEEALRLLESNFPDGGSDRVAMMRSTLAERIHKQEMSQRQAWLDAFRECRLEITLGDPLLGLQKALEMPPPPKLTLANQHYPPVADLFSAVAGSLESSVAEWPPPEQDLLETVHSEARMSRLVGDLRAMIEEHPSAQPLEDLQLRLGDLSEELARRGDVRGAERQKRLEKQLQQEQDMLLAAARAHHQAGDLSRALSTYDRLIAIDSSGKLGQILSKEVGGVRSQQDSYLEARGLAEAGDHEVARELLKETFAFPGQHLLPWNVTSSPNAARARFPNGTERVTPFVVESAIGTPVEMIFELDGHESLRVVVPQPNDRHVVLSRNSDRRWGTDGQVEALPVSTGGDHVVANRRGRLARIGEAMQPIWETEIGSLGGIARSPIFLPRKPGVLLLLTEEGDAWFVDAATGQMEGPWSFGVPPSEGPIATEAGVYARFEDGRTALWTTRLRPEVYSAPRGGAGEAPASLDAIFEGTAHGSSVGMSALRHGSGSADRLDSPWTDWTVQITREAFEVRLRGVEGEEPGGFAVRRSGDWDYVAWEAPHSRIPQGRLWVSDGDGLRAFEPESITR